jgi:hypothetical protein
MLRQLGHMTLPLLAWLVIVGTLILACFHEADARRKRAYAAAGIAILKFLLLMTALWAFCVAVSLLAQAVWMFASPDHLPGDPRSRQTPSVGSPPCGALSCRGRGSGMPSFASTACCNRASTSLMTLGSLLFEQLSPQPVAG